VGVSADISAASGRAQLVWLRRDLRLSDNRALSRAAATGPVVPVFVWDWTPAGFSTLVTAIKAAGLTKALSGKGPFTVFASTNAAFKALPAGTLKALLAKLKQLAKVLEFHVLNGKVLARSITNGMTAKTRLRAPA
jgi:uncharacterized surface protein with fasciclin (FAS1) repeats